MQDCTNIKAEIFYVSASNPSKEISIQDGKDTIYFEFYIKQVLTEEEGKAQLDVLDDFHAKITIYTVASLLTRMPPMYLGTYDRDKDLYLVFTAAPCDKNGVQKCGATFFYKKDFLVS